MADQGLSAGLNSLSYQGVRSTNPPQMIVMQRAPTPNDVIGYVLGTQWLHRHPDNPADSRQYVLTSVAQNVGVWVPLNSDVFVDLPDHSVALGTGAIGLGSTGPEATVGYVLTSNGLSADPSFQAPANSITLPDHSVALGTGVSGLNSTGPIATLGAPLISNGNSADPSFGVASVSGGGTGLTACAPYAVYCGGLTGEGPVQQVAGLGTSGQVLTSNGLSMLPTWQNVGELGGGGILLTVFDTPGSGTHTLNTNTLALTVLGFGAGAGGGSGRQGASTMAGGGGGGGNGGTFFFSNIPATYFGGGGASVAYTVGAGGTGGYGQTVNDTDGVDGANGGYTSFGDIGINGTGLEAMGGSGGTTTEGLGGVNSYCLNMNVPGMVMSGGGGSGDFVDGFDAVESQGSTMFPSSGGGGAGADSGTERAGGGGANISSYQSLGLTTVVAGGTGGTESISINGGSGLDGDTAGSYFCGGSGGAGGGGQHVGMVAGIGGDGGFPGGGGGGGGGSLNGTTSGAGGNGGDGAIYLIEYLSGGSTPPPPSSFQINQIVLDTPGSGTYTPTSGMTQCIVECLGGGGGGSSSVTVPGNIASGGYGGNAGGYCKKLFDAAAIGASQPYVIGAGGVGGANTGSGHPGTDGAATTFGTSPFLTANGGPGATGSTTLVGGLGVGGDLNLQGGTGGFSYVQQPGSPPGNYIGGIGGSCTYGTAAPSFPSTPVIQGSGYGFGGGGSTYSGYGGDGGSGLIIITEYIS
jgi:hypothetical protein